MRPIKVGESYNNLESKRINLGLEKIMIENVTALEAGLNKGDETKGYWVDIYYLANLEEQSWGSTVVYKSETFKNKKKAKKEYNRTLEMLKNGNYILKSDLRGNLRLELHLGEYLLQICCKMLEKCFESKEEE